MSRDARALPEGGMRRDAAALASGEGLMEPSVPSAGYSFKFDNSKDSWVCSVHGEVDDTGWVQCWNGCDEGYFDDYEEDPIECEPGEISTCSECNGEGGWRVCGQCNANNPDVQW